MQIERVSADVRSSTSGQTSFERQGVGWQRVGLVSLVGDGHSVMRAKARVECKSVRVACVGEQ
jgi:hypothetical protein